ncbi:MAG: DUF1476 domain-containing protein [Phycisphaerae bacterium]|jgi:hypothetical protein|nr:DUF1476 domain-containing protein [Phycisphaerae bacterium]MBT5381857.1 DUF1476 domain-containing protein [Phycisphaerae bacterium]MBT5584524.1 DUF1476 domain-containing protein [Phycisphaerae bacterium]MBT5656172.1 DUF1476 domain-containing protein [Phycisphaerae bacterium]MBT7351244.1 DUF1476 domain-containing protein [Phycisphaerae bacterium]
MSGFSDRERGQEEKFAREQDQEFRVHARRDKMLGLWVAEQMGLAGDEANAYAMTLVKADMREPGDDDVVQQALADLAEKGLSASEEEIRSQMAKFEAHVRAE